MGWFQNDLITNYGEWKEAFVLQSRAEQEEREFIEEFLPKLFMYLGIGLVLVVIVVLILPPKTRAGGVGVTSATGITGKTGGG